jgi:AraC-like DNA-binding protein
MTVFMRGASLTNYARVAAEVGLDPRAMVRRVGLDARILTDPEFKAPAGQVVELLEASAEVSGCDTFGLQMSIGRRFSDYGPISLVMAHQPTLRGALETMVRYQRMLNRALLLHLEPQGEDVTLRQEVLAGDRRRRRQAVELAVGTLCTAFRLPSGRGVAPRAAYFTHPPPRDLSIHRRVFAAPVYFQSDFNGLICPKHALDAPNAVADPGLVQQAEQLVSTLPYAGGANAFVDDVQAAIRSLLPNEGASIGAVADRLGASQRTLQRRLAEEGADFSHLLNDLRREHAMRHLSNPRASLAEVAGLVGYSHPTSFARWFSAEFGVSPRVWRAQARYEDAPAT